MYNLCMWNDCTSTDKKNSKNAQPMNCRFKKFIL